MSNFLGEVLQAKGTATFEELNDALRNLDNKISFLKISIVQSLNSTFVLSETDLDRVVQWYTEIIEIQNFLTELEAQLGKDKQVLHSAHQDLEAITYELSQCQDSIAILKSVVEVVKNLERVDPADFYHASELIATAEKELSNLAYAFPIAEDHIWIKQLRARFSDLVVDVYEYCRKDWGALFKFDKNCLIVYPHATNIKRLITSLKNVKSFNRIWEKFMSMLWQELFKPACSREFQVEVTTGNKMGAASGIKYDVDQFPVREKDSSLLLNDSMAFDLGDLGLGDAAKGSIIIKANKLDKPIDNASHLFENLKELIKIFHILFHESEGELMNFSAFFGPKINEELDNKFLKTLILQRCGGDIEVARSDVAAMGRFRDNLAEEFDFIFPEGNVFDYIEINFNNLFEIQVREALIVKVRELIRSDVHNTEEINFEAQAISNSALSADEVVLLRKNPAIFPRCVVSKSIAEVIRLLKEHKKRYPNDIVMYSGAFSLYQGLVKIPKHEADAGELVPLTSVLIHNNSLFLAHHAGFTFDSCDDVVPDLRAKASQALAFMMRCVRSKLNELISNAMSSIEERVDRNIDITHDFLVITAELKRLDSVMNGVLPPLRWQDILATLVDHTLNEMCSKVLCWDDIAANSASELANAFSQFAASTSNLFKGEGSTPREVEALTARAVKKWQQFRMLIFVLTASMKEIETKWVGGCGPLAIEFNAEEVRKLVRALFQNTDRRAAFLATIK